MTDQITTPAQMREAAARLIDDRCADILSKQNGKIPEVDQNLWLMAALLPDLAAAIRALPVAEPFCTWPSCGHTAKGQCNPTFAPPVAEQQAIRDQALNDAAQAASNRAAYFRDAAETASEAGFHALRAFHAMRELCLVEIAAAIRLMKGKPE